MRQLPSCSANLTSKRSLENYLHSRAILEACGLNVGHDDESDVPGLLARKSLGIDSRWENLPHRTRSRMRHRFKKRLNTTAVERMTPAHAGLEQRGIPSALGPGSPPHGIPNRLATQRVHGHDPGFTTPPTFDHALNGLEGMEIVAVDPTHADRYRLGHFSAERHQLYAGAEDI